MRALKYITGHVIFKLRYNQIYQLKPTQFILCFTKKCHNQFTIVTYKERVLGVRIEGPHNNVTGRRS